MRIIIAGTRKLDGETAYRSVEIWMEEIGLTIETEGHVILSGCGGNVDKTGENWADYWNWPCRRFPADWDTHGKSAGPLRNAQMVAEADALILIWDGKSPGSADIKRKALSAGLPIYETVIIMKSTPGKRLEPSCELKK